MLSQQDKANILKSQIKNTGMKVLTRNCRFPMIDGIQQKVTLISNITNEFMNIGFVDSVENTINGNIADSLLDQFPGVFKVMKVNNIKVDAGIKQDSSTRIKNEIIEQLKREFDFVPKKDNKSNRTREDESKLLSKSKEEERTSVKNNPYKK